MLYRAIKIAQKVFTVSEFSKQRIIFHFGNKKEIIVAHNGLRIDLLDYDSTHAQRIYDFEYVLFIGNIKKHKGLDILLKAMEDIDKKLVIIGSVQNMKTSDKIIYEKIRLNKNIRFEEYIQNDQTLYAIISHADILVQPSRYEGFGIPPLESLYLGTPVIISDIPVFKEIYGKLPLVFFKDGDAEDLVLKLKDDNFPVINKQIIRNTYKYQATAFTILKQMR
jgi:glycosyltransferase involved in cell wall biosynthesis